MVVHIMFEVVIAVWICNSLAGKNFQALFI
uniref:Uncharacterized protein n=1 Tax=Rhizophora mucronata TaxID=61149 RepID=A0A2P2NKB7_RHIMU